MKEDLNMAPSEIRVKLHIKVNNDSTDVKNLWMCLNYDQKPCISHVIDHIKKNYFTSKQKQMNWTENFDAESDIKLYLDDFWLPPYENSRLIRENDCIKVEVNRIESFYSSETHMNKQIQSKNIDLFHLKHAATAASSNISSYLPEPTQKQDKKKKIFDTNYNDEDQEEENEDTYYNHNKVGNEQDYYNHYYEMNTYVTDNGKKQNQNKQNPKLNSSSLWLSNQNPASALSQSSKVDDKAPTVQPKQKQKGKKKTVVVPEQQSAPITNQSNQVKCFKKFAIGNYAHLLNNDTTISESKTKAQKKYDEADEHLSEEQVIDNYYHSLNLDNNSTKPSKKQQKQQTKKINNESNNESSDLNELNKIASNVNATGKQKWKNSTKQTNANGPKHIIFPSTTESSDSTSSSESESESAKPTVVNKKPEETKQKPKYYEPSKEEQLNSVSYNRSFLIQNTKSLIDFKKIFNESKLNAPQTEEFADKSVLPQQAKEINSKKKKKNTAADNKQIKNDESAKQENDISNNNTSDLNKSTSSSCDSEKKTKKSRSPFVKIDFDKLEKLNGQPRANDKIAFQILEISSNFTPEVSQYKTATVIELDAKTNEVTLKLNNKYNSVLKRPNKFTVVLDETEEEANECDLNESSSSGISRKSNDENENILKVDWRNLINLKLMPDEKKIMESQNSIQSNNQHLMNQLEVN